MPGCVMIMFLNGSSCLWNAPCLDISRESFPQEFGSSCACWVGFLNDFHSYRNMVRVKLKLKEEVNSNIPLRPVMAETATLTLSFRHLKIRI